MSRMLLLSKSQLDFGLALLGREALMLEKTTPSNPSTATQQSAYFARVYKIEDGHDDEDAYRIEDVEQYF